MSDPGGTSKHAVEKAMRDVMNETPVISHDIDKDNAFLLYATFCGDVPRTAAALNITHDEVISLVEAGKWNEKLRGILELKKSGRAGDVERAINRAINFVQAHKLRVFLERVVQHICVQPLDKLEDWLFTYQYGKGQEEPVRKLATRPFADLAVAIEKCHVLTYMALGDSPGERKGREAPPDADVSGGELHARIAAAMSKEPKVIEKVP